LTITSGNTTITKALVAVDESAGTYTATLTDNQTKVDLGEYTYSADFVAAGNVESGIAYMIDNEEKRIAAIKKKYGLVFDNDMMTSAFTNAKKSTTEFLFNKNDRKYFTDNTLIEIENYVADNLNYGFVCKDNIRVYEYTVTPPYTLTELNDNISSIVFDYPNGNTIITMDSDYPSSSCDMKVEYYKIAEKFSEVYDKIKYVQELQTYLYLLDHTEINKLQLGFTTKEINGISFTFDKDSIDDLKIKVRQWIDNEANMFQEIVITDVTISNKYWGKVNVWQRWWIWDWCI